MNHTRSQLMETITKFQKPDHPFNTTLGSLKTRLPMQERNSINTNDVGTLTQDGFGRQHKSFLHKAKRLRIIKRFAKPEPNFP